MHGIGNEPRGPFKEPPVGWVMIYKGHSLATQQVTQHGSRPFKVSVLWVRCFFCCLKSITGTLCL